MKYRFEADASVEKRRRVHEREECLIGAKLLGWPLERFADGETKRWREPHTHRICHICDGPIEQ